MRIYSAFVLLLLGTARSLLAACDPSVPIADPCPRTGIHCNENFNSCGWWERLNQDRTYLDAKGCTEDRPCTEYDDEPVVIEEVDATDDDFEFMAGDRTLIAVACRCAKNCTTPATLQFENQTGALISLTGGGTLACSTSATLSYTTFDTTDDDRLISTTGLVRFDVTNTPTAGQRIFFVVTYLVAP